MGRKFSALREKKLRLGDSGVLYVTTCSDVDTSLKYSRRLLECFVINRLGDGRYIVRCSENLRDEPYKDFLRMKNFLHADEAPIYATSPFLMTMDEYEAYKNDSGLLSRWLSEVSHTLMGFEVPDYMLKWQVEVTEIMKGLGIKPEEAVSDILDDFSPKFGKELITFPR